MPPGQKRQTRHEEQFGKTSSQACATQKGNVATLTVSTPTLQGVADAPMPKMENMVHKFLGARSKKESETTIRSLDVLKIAPAQCYCANHSVVPRPGHELA